MITAKMPLTKLIIRILKYYILKYKNFYSLPIEELHQTLPEIPQQSWKIPLGTKNFQVQSILSSNTEFFFAFLLMFEHFGIEICYSFQIVQDFSRQKYMKHYLLLVYSFYEIIFKIKIDYS